MELDSNSFAPDSQGGFISSEQNTLEISIRNARFENAGGRDLVENFFYFKECSNVQFENVEFEGYNCLVEGFIMAEQSNMVIVNGSFRNNSVVTGMVYVSDYTNVTISNSTFE